MGKYKQLEHVKNVGTYKTLTCVKMVKQMGKFKQLAVAMQRFYALWAVISLNNPTNRFNKCFWLVYIGLTETFLFLPPSLSFFN